MAVTMATGSVEIGGGDRSERRRRRAVAVVRIAAAVAIVALAARVDVPVPGTPVPQSLQTLAVVLVGAWLGLHQGAAALGLYVASGALGVPVLANGAGGLEHLTGPTAGYLVGFVLGAGLMGWWVRRPKRREACGSLSEAGRALAGALAAHVVILTMGWARLASMVGGEEAWTAGVAPFLAGAMAKSLAAAVLWTVLSGVSGRGMPGTPTSSSSGSRRPGSRRGGGGESRRSGAAEERR
jgi:biotin transport system substrate-specific component